MVELSKVEERLSESSILMTSKENAQLCKLEKKK